MASDGGRVLRSREELMRSGRLIPVGSPVQAAPCYGASPGVRNGRFVTSYALSGNHVAPGYGNPGLQATPFSIGTTEHYYTTDGGAASGSPGYSPQQMLAGSPVSMCSPQASPLGCLGEEESFVRAAPGPNSYGMRHPSAGELSQEQLQQLEAQQREQQLQLQARLRQMQPEQEGEFDLLSFINDYIFAPVTDGLDALLSAGPTFISAEQGDEAALAQDMLPLPEDGTYGLPAEDSLDDQAYQEAAYQEALAAGYAQGSPHSMGSPAPGLPRSLPEGAYVSPYAIDAQFDDYEQARQAELYERRLRGEGFSPAAQYYSGAQGCILHATDALGTGSFVGGDVIGYESAAGVPYSVEEVLCTARHVEPMLQRAPHSPSSADGLGMRLIGGSSTTLRPGTPPPASTPPIMMGPPVYAYHAPAPFVPTPPASPDRREQVGGWGMAPRDLRGTGLDQVTAGDLYGVATGARTPGGGVYYVSKAPAEEAAPFGRFSGPGGLRKVAVVAG